MKKEFKNQALAAEFDLRQGALLSLRNLCDPDAMNWVIAPEVWEKYGYPEEKNCQLGNSVLAWGSGALDTAGRCPDDRRQSGNSVCFLYSEGPVALTHEFVLENHGLRWNIRVQNTGETPLQLDTLYHPLPVSYVMHKTAEENLGHSCAFVPSLGGSRPYVVCKKRSGQGPNLMVVNTTGGMRSAGSLCRYENLFFEKAAPSLSGLVLFYAVTAFPLSEKWPVDWPYKEMASPVELAPGQAFDDSYAFHFCLPGQEAQVLLDGGVPLIRYEPCVPVGYKAHFQVTSRIQPVSWKLCTAGEAELHTESRGKVDFLEENNYRIEIPAVTAAGEYQLQLCLADGSEHRVLFAVYPPIREMVEAFCRNIYENLFIADTESPDYAGYRSLSRQGESCAKGSLLLLKNLLTVPAAAEVRQVERNAVHYLRRHWLDENFEAIRKYPGGFARIIDFDYLILEFYLLSCFRDEILALNPAREYLLWAYRTACYRFDAAGKLPREAEETRFPSMFSGMVRDMIAALGREGLPEEAKKLQGYWDAHRRHQLARGEGHECFVTEHYFDNAGISVFAETMLNSGYGEPGMQAARLLLANVAHSNDYRNFAPDRWWEALAPMYHNLWAAYSAKAMHTAYLHSGQTEYLFSAYRAMMPLFYNYDWNAVSAARTLRRGEGVSAYCLTSPNFNLLEASRNRFGQSIFNGEFFEDMAVEGDDWDLGADLIAYLESFGQSCYVVEDGGGWRCVNGSLENMGEERKICSWAAYPARYDIRPLELVVACKTPGWFIHAVWVRQGRCTAVQLEGAGNGVPVVEVLAAGKPVGDWVLCFDRPE